MSVRYTLGPWMGSGWGKSPYAKGGLIRGLLRGMDGKAIVRVFGASSGGRKTHSDPDYAGNRALVQNAPEMYEFLLWLKSTYEDTHEFTDNFGARRLAKLLAKIEREGRSGR